MDYNVNMEFCCESYLAKYLIENADLGQTSVVIGDYEDIDMLIEALLEDYEINIITPVESFDENYDGLYDLYIDENYEVSIEKLGNSIENYLICDADNVLISSYCPCSYINYLDNEDVEYDLFDYADDQIDLYYGEPVEIEFSDTDRATPNIVINGDLIICDTYYN